MTSDFDNTALKKAFGSFATGVAVATSHSSGFTINSFSSLSLSPPLIIFNIYKTVQPSILLDVFLSNLITRSTSFFVILSGGKILTTLSEAGTSNKF